MVEPSALCPSKPSWGQGSMHRCENPGLCSLSPPTHRGPPLATAFSGFSPLQPSTLYPTTLFRTGEVRARKALKGHLIRTPGFTDKKVEVQQWPGPHPDSPRKLVAVTGPQGPRSEDIL